MPRAGRTLPWTVLVATLVALAGAGPAAAHTDLESSTPAAGEVLDATPAEVSLVFTEEMDPALGAAVLRVGGEEVGRLALAGGTRSTELVAAVEPGRLPDVGVARWRVDYRVTSRDGHPVTGSVSFRAPTPSGRNDDGGDAAPPTSPSADDTGSGDAGAEQSEAEEEAAEGREGGSVVNVLAVAGIVVFVLVLALVAMRRVGRAEEQDDEPGQGA